MDTLLLRKARRLDALTRIMPLLGKRSLVILLPGFRGSGDALRVLSAWPVSIVGLSLRKVKTPGLKLAPLARLTALRFLDLAQTELPLERYQVLGKLPELRSLSLHGAKVDDRACRALANARKLEALALTGIFAKVTNRCATHLARLDKLRYLDLAETVLTDPAMPHIAKLRGLRGLRLHTVRITDVGLASVVQLKRLRVLDLRSSWISQKSLARLSGLVELRVLRVCGPLTKHPEIGNELRHLASARRLEVLDLSECTIEGNALAHLKRLQRLRTLQLGLGTSEAPRRGADLPWQRRYPLTTFIYPDELRLAEIYNQLMEVKGVVDMRILTPEANVTPPPLRTETRAGERVHIASILSLRRVALGPWRPTPGEDPGYPGPGQ